MIYVALFIVFSVVLTVMASGIYSIDEIDRRLAAVIMFVAPGMLTAFIWAIVTLVSISFGVDWCVG